MRQRSQRNAGSNPGASGIRIGESDSGVPRDCAAVGRDVIGGWGVGGQAEFRRWPSDQYTVSRRFLYRESGGGWEVCTPPSRSL
ncbi:hypothetical protein chiPu_0024874 [Chiloscyllium punctatum]|uniref:Uncharacterized protein n=1 Tax=Chiloscyllium punctatum TaxID=137246 RepID=A0A401TDA5_CHIPU|nr:hypothetical protein [Chiloscyllium punctatum]